MITKKAIREISFKLCDFAKRSKDIKFERHCGHQDILIITPTKANKTIIAEIIDFLGDFDWGNVDDYQGHEFYKYDEIWYHSIDSRLSYDADEMEKYEYTPYYEVVLEFKFEEV